MKIEHKSRYARLRRTRPVPKWVGSRTKNPRGLGKIRGFRSRSAWHGKKAF